MKVKNNRSHSIETLIRKGKVICYNSQALEIQAFIKAENDMVPVLDYRPSGYL
jgi:hypothetical protein